MSVSTIQQSNARERCVRRGVRAWLLAVVLIALLAAACGGEGTAALVVTPAQEAELGPDAPEPESDGEAGAESSVPQGEAASTTTPASTTIAGGDGGPGEAEAAPPPTTVVVSTATSVVGRDIGASKGWSKPPISESEKQELIRKGGASRWGNEPAWKVDASWNKSLEWDENTDSETGMVSVEVSVSAGVYLCEIKNTQANWNKVYLDVDPAGAGCELIVDHVNTKIDGKSYSCHIKPTQANYDKLYIDRDPTGCTRVQEYRPWCVEGSAEEEEAFKLPYEERKCDTPLDLIMLPYCRHETEVNVSNWREQPDPNEGYDIEQPGLYILEPYLYFYNTGYERFEDECTRLLAYYGEVYEGP